MRSDEPPARPSGSSAPSGSSPGSRAEAILERVTRPLRRMWASEEPIDAYALVHLAGAAGDALVAIALADSIFFSLPVGEAKLKVALYLGLTMAPLAVASPALVILLDRGGFLRAIAFAVAAGRAAVALYAAPRFGTLLVFPLAFALLVLSKANGVAKNGLIMAYAPSGEGLVSANARLGRLTVIGAALAAGPGLAFLRLGGARSVLTLAAVAYAVTMLLMLRLHPVRPLPRSGEVGIRGKVPALSTPAAGTAGLKAASGFLLFLLAFALRGSDRPTYWFGVLAAAAAAGGFLGDVVAPHLSRFLREEAVVFASALGAGLAALLAYARFELAVLALFAGLAGMATEFGRLAFQSLMQRLAPQGAHGRVFVRYEVAFQLAWVIGAFLAAALSIHFRTGVLMMAAFYLALGLGYLGGAVFNPTRRARPA